MRQILHCLIQLPLIGKFLLLLKLGRKQEYIHQTGWFNSAKTRQSVNKNGQPLAWFTYPFINFITPRLSKNITVYEYGSGNGTLWWAKHVKHVTAMEHHQGWAEKISKNAPNNVTILQADLAPQGNYASAINQSNKKYDIIVVDGRERVNCAINAASALSKKGVIIWDNSEREHYIQGMEELAKNGFKRLDFWGMVAINSTISCTTVFYRPHNILDI